MNLKKIMDSVSEEQLVNHIVSDLKSRLDAGQTPFYGGSDSPGKYISYCRTADLRKCLKKYWIDLPPLDDLELTPDQINEMSDKELLKTLNSAFSFGGFDLDHKYISIFQDWNDTGDGGAYPFDVFEIDTMDYEVPWDLYNALLEYGVPLEKLHYTNINDPDYLEEFKDLVSESFWDEYYG